MKEKTVSIKPVIVTVLLAGGRSSRMMGKNKALLPWHGKPLICVLKQTLGATARTMVISANHDIEQLKQCNLPIIKDNFGHYEGPLAGILAAMTWARDNCESCDYLALCSCDTPFVPENLVSQLEEAVMSAEKRPKLVFPCFEKRVHPLHGLWSLGLINQLQDYLENGERKVMFFGQKNEAVLVPFAAERIANKQDVDPFTNLNTPEDYSYYQQLSQTQRNL